MGASTVSSIPPRPAPPRPIPRAPLATLTSAIRFLCSLYFPLCSSLCRARCFPSPLLHSCHCSQREVQEPVTRELSCFEEGVRGTNSEATGGMTEEGISSGCFDIVKIVAGGGSSGGIHAVDRGRGGAGLARWRTIRCPGGREREASLRRAADLHFNHRQPGNV